MSDAVDRPQGNWQRNLDSLLRRKRISHEESPVLSARGLVLDRRIAHGIRGSDRAAEYRGDPGRRHGLRRSRLFQPAVEDPHAAHRFAGT